LGADIASFDLRERAVLATMPGLSVEHGRVHQAEAEDRLADHPWLRALADAPFTPPPPGDIPREEVRQLVKRGLVLATEGLYLAGREAQAAEPGATALVHVVLEVLHRSPAAGDGLGGRLTGGEQHERVEDLVVQPGGAAERVVPPLDRSGQSGTEIGLEGGV